MTLTDLRSCHAIDRSAAGSGVGERRKKRFLEIRLFLHQPRAPMKTVFHNGRQFAKKTLHCIGGRQSCMSSGTGSSCSVIGKLPMDRMLFEHCLKSTMKAIFPPESWKIRSLLQISPFLKRFLRRRAKTRRLRDRDDFRKIKKPFPLLDNQIGGFNGRSGFWMHGRSYGVVVAVVVVILVVGLWVGILCIDWETRDRGIVIKARLPRRSYKEKERTIPIKARIAMSKVLMENSEQRQIKDLTCKEPSTTRQLTESMSPVIAYHIPNQGRGRRSPDTMDGSLMSVGETGWEEWWAKTVNDIHSAIVRSKKGSGTCKKRNKRPLKQNHVNANDKAKPTPVEKGEGGGNQRTED